MTSDLSQTERFPEVKPLHLVHVNNPVKRTELETYRASPAQSSVKPKTEKQSKASQTKQLIKYFCLFGCLIQLTIFSSKKKP